MGLFSFIGRAFNSIVEDVVEPIIKTALPIVSQLAPIAAQLAPIVAPQLAGIVGPGGPLGNVLNPGGVASTLAGQAIAGPCPAPGIVGRGATASPVTNAAFRRPNPSQLPARPQFGLNQIAASQIPTPPPFFTNAFAQVQRAGAFTQPGQRPFTPSFNTGRGAQFQAPQFAQAPQVSGFPPINQFRAASSIVPFF